jgi:membrane complex biogenesis BtpA family protein
MRIPGPVIGVVHLLPLPGSPGFDGRIAPVVRRAVRDANAYAEGGADAVIVENHGDAPFVKGPLAPETVAALARCAAEIVAAVPVPVGVNALRNDARAALGAAVVAGGSFVRVNVLSGVVATDQGLIEGCAADLLRARAAMTADVAILADVHVKHGRPLAGGPIGQDARDLLGRGGADAVIVSGVATGAPTDLADLRAVREALPDAPVLAGSGVTVKNVREVLQIADAVIVGTALKRAGRTNANVEVARVRKFVDAAGR